MKRALKIFIVLPLLFLYLNLVGHGEPQTTTEAERLMMKVKEMKDKAIVVEVRENGIERQFERRWSQDGKGSWRWDRISGTPTSREISIDLNSVPDTMIYNAAEGRAWLIRGDTAYQITDRAYLESVGEASSPFYIPVLASDHGAYAGYFSQTGEDGVWEWRTDSDDPAIKKLPGRNRGDEFWREPWQRIEFLGPEGFLSKEATGDIVTGEGAEIRWEKNFAYLIAGGVADDLFQLPANVKEIKSFEEWVEEMEASMEVPR